VTWIVRIYPTPDASFVDYRMEGFPVGDALTSACERHEGLHGPLDERAIYVIEAEA
jgi:hypothetical protein